MDAVKGMLFLNLKISSLWDPAKNSVIKSIASSEFYISCHIENSFNAASEGIFLSSNSLIQIIGPHKELLMNENKNTSASITKRCSL